MSTSKQEEIISALWAICSILAFGLGFDGWGWVFLVKAVSDCICSLMFAFKELKQEKGQRH